MRHARIFLLALSLHAFAQKPFTLQQILSAPYSSNLTAAPVGSLFAWVEHTEGRNNLWVGGPNQPARQLTHNTADDAQDITNLDWSPDASALAYTYGAPNGASGKPANPAHLQRATPLTMIVQPLAPTSAAINLGEGRSPLFLHDGKSLLFTRGGQVWIACALNCHPEERSDEGIASSAGTTGRLSGKPLSSPHQLIYDRGSASSLTLSPNGTLLAYISHRREANEPSHSYLALFDLTTLALTFPAPSTANDSAPTFSPDGHQLAWLRSPFTQAPEFALNRTSPNPWSIQLMNLHMTCHPEEHRDEGPASPACVATNAKSTPGLEGAGIQPHRQQSKAAGALAPEGNPRTIFSPVANQPGSVLPHLSTGEPRLFFTANKDIVFYSEADGWVHLYSLDPTQEDAPKLRTPGEFEVEDAALSLDGRSLMYASGQIFDFGPKSSTFKPYKLLRSSDDDRRHLWKLDLTRSEAIPVVLPGSNFDIATHPQFSAEGTTLAALVANPWWPMQTELVSLSGKAEPLHPADAKATPNFNILIAPPSKVLLPSTNSLQIHAQLFLPPNVSPTTKHPAILFLHGGPRRQMLLGYPAMDYYSNAYAMNQYLASRGFIVLSVNYRCGIGYGLEFRQCDHGGADGAEEYDDVLAAATYLKTRPDVDPARIGLWGGSYGGYLTALGLARNSDIFAAGVDFHGVHDWNLEDNVSDWKIGSNAQQDAIAARALASSPLADISHWRSPILLIHGDDDPDVAYAQTPILADALRARNANLPPHAQVDVEELIFPDEVHGFLLHRDWLAAYTAAAAFFERTLKP